MTVSTLYARFRFHCFSPKDFSIPWEMSQPPSWVSPKEVKILLPKRILLGTTSRTTFRVPSTFFLPPRLALRKRFPRMFISYAKWAFAWSISNRTTSRYRLGLWTAINPSAVTQTPSIPLISTSSRAIGNRLPPNLVPPWRISWRFRSWSKRCRNLKIQANLHAQMRCWCCLSLHVSRARKLYSFVPSPKNWPKWHLRRCTYLSKRDTDNLY